MQKVIDGLRYDCDKAERLFCWDNGKYVSDFGYFSKTLYRTAAGRWFIHYEGGALSSMGVTVGNGMGGSEDIECITEDDAYLFLEKHSDETKAQEAIDKYFADRIQEA